MYSSQKLLRLSYFCVYPIKKTKKINKKLCQSGLLVVAIKGNTQDDLIGTSICGARTYPDRTSGASSEGVLLRNKPVPNSTRFIGELVNEYRESVYGRIHPG